MTDRNEMEAALESVLFVSPEPVPRARLIEMFDDEERELAAEALASVLERYSAAEARGVMIEEVAGGVRLVTRPEMVGWLRRFFDVSGGSKLSMAALETLAIVAYRQPVTGPEIQELRSVNPTGVLHTLLEKRLVRIAGRKEVVGKPFLYATTREFLVHFGLNSLRDLPPLEEFEETFGPASADAGDGGGAAVASALRLEDQLPLELEDREERILREAAELAEDEPPAEDEHPVEDEPPAEAEQPAADEQVEEAEQPAEDEQPAGVELAQAGGPGEGSGPGEEELSAHGLERAPRGSRRETGMEADREGGDKPEQPEDPGEEP